MAPKAPPLAFMPNWASNKLCVASPQGPGGSPDLSLLLVELRFSDAIPLGQALSRKYPQHGHTMSLTTDRHGGGDHLGGWVYPGILNGSSKLSLTAKPA